MKIILRNLKTLVVKNMRNFLLTLSLLLFVSTANATNTEFTAGTLDIINLPNQSGTTNWNLSDDSISGTINLGLIPIFMEKPLHQVKAQLMVVGHSQVILIPVMTILQTHSHNPVWI